MPTVAEVETRLYYWWIVVTFNWQKEGEPGLDSGPFESYDLTEQTARKMLENRESVVRVYVHWKEPVE